MLPSEPEGWLQVLSDGDKERALWLMFADLFEVHPDRIFERVREAESDGLLDDFLHVVDLVDTAVGNQNRLLRPPTEVDDGRVAFYEENQCVFRWYTEPKGRTPSVWVGEPDGEARLEYEELPGFLIGLLVFEASMETRWAHTNGVSEPDSIDDGMAPLQNVPVFPWMWPKDQTSFHVAEGVAAHTYPADEGMWIFTAATEAGRIEYLRELNFDEIQFSSA